ncbi:HAD family hydrolase [Ramlibacter sp. AN1133]|uniref:HAD family hydrolase n=1 Tax=Ramlibacter sp. AN1133 TaxID=3133429 RepID=UPI0030BC2C90
MPQLPPIVLDLDGVVLQTNLLKHRAMLSLFEDCPEQSAISEYILSNVGVRRDVKIAHILRTFARGSATDDLGHYLVAYAGKLEQLLRSAPLVPGVEDFLRSDRSFFLSSSAPEPEIELQLRSRGLWSRFERVFGASKPKAMALSEVHQASGSRPVFFGDSPPDLDAAVEAGASFVAVVFERDNFAGVPVVKLPDFTSAERVQYCIDAASRAVV